MKVLLAVTCVLAAASAYEVVPGAREGSFLNSIQEMLINATKTLYPDGENMMQTIKLAVMTARNDLCKINNRQEVNNPQEQNSIILGKTCKRAFVNLYNEEPGRCGGVFCDVLTDFEIKTKESLTRLISAEYDSDFVDIIEERFINPIMEYSCICSVKMMDAWMGCKERIGESDIWFTLMNFGGFNTTAEYLGGRDWKDYWVDLVANRVPWEDIETMLERSMANLCQRNTDIRKGDHRCYTYLYDTITAHVKGHLKSLGLTSAKRGRGGKSNVPENCIQYDYSLHSGSTYLLRNGITRATFSSYHTKILESMDSVFEKFCVESCVDYYQEKFMGCCTASLILDEALETSIINVANEIKKIYVELFPEDESAAEAIRANFSESHQHELEFMRNPTCEDLDISYDVTPCTEGDMNIEDEDQDPCAGLSGKAAKKCKKKQKKKKHNEDEDEDGDVDCEGLTGKQLKKCRKKAGGGGYSAATNCSGLSGKALHICKKRAKKGGK